MNDDEGKILLYYIANIIKIRIIDAIYPWIYQFISSLSSLPGRERLFERRYIGIPNFGMEERMSQGAFDGNPFRRIDNQKAGDQIFGFVGYIGPFWRCEAAGQNFSGGNNEIGNFREGISSDSYDLKRKI